MRHSTRVQQALARLPEVDPAISALAIWCSFRDAQGPTATEGETIFVGPEFPLMPISEQTGVISHHVLHVALRHSARRSEAETRLGTGFRSETYDLACDALVNEALLQGGHALPRPAVRAADIVAMLPADQRPDDILADWDSEKLYAAMVLSSAGGGGSGDIERYAEANGFEPDLKGSASDTAEAEIWAGRVEQAMSVGQRAGSGVGAILSRFGDLPKATVPWEIRLRRLLNKALWYQPQPSYRRPSRAWLARDSHARLTNSAMPVFEPGTVRDRKRPRLVIGIDTSSSIPEITLDMFASEAISMIRRTGTEAFLLGFDTEVHTRGKFERAEALEAVAMRRGGGTEFDPVLTEADVLDPSIIVLLTDLDAPATVVPRAQVLWALPFVPTVKPSFGDVFLLKDEPAAVR